MPLNEGPHYTQRVLGTPISFKAYSFISGYWAPWGGFYTQETNLLRVKHYRSGCAVLLLFCGVESFGEELHQILSFLWNLDNLTVPLRKGGTLGPTQSSPPRAGTWCGPMGVGPPSTCQAKFSQACSPAQVVILLYVVGLTGGNALRQCRKPERFRTVGEYKSFEDISQGSEGPIILAIALLGVVVARAKIQSPACGKLAAAIASWRWP